MDCSWLLEDDVDEGNPVSESDSEKEQNELEERLYGIIDHSAKDEPLAPEIAKHFSVQCAEDGNIIIELKNSLDEIKSEERKGDFSLSEDVTCLDNSFDEVLPNNNNNDEVVVISESFTNEEPQQGKKWTRYSDVNIDHNEIDEDEIQDISSKSIDYFRIGPSFFNKNKNRKFRRLAIPKSLKNFDWKTNANESFISIQTYNNITEVQILETMVAELKRENPHEKRGFLLDFARKLYARNKKCFKRRERVKNKKFLKNNKINGVTAFVTPTNEINKPQNTPILHDYIKYDSLSPHGSKYLDGGSHVKAGTKINGCISLSQSPFIPCSSTPYKSKESTPVIDLTSTEPHSVLNNQTFESEHSSQSAKKGIPKKWSKKMIDYYTVTSKIKMEADINTITNNLKRTSVAADWWLDPRDKLGSYRKSLKRRLTGGRRCANCKEFGHFIRDCPKPKKILTCTLCGEYYHTDYSCPNTICRKCGGYIPKNVSETFGGLCQFCYQSDYDDNLVCHVCGQYTHYDAICTDLWRKFHATTTAGSELVIPEVSNENPRKFCSNCAGRGHFSHQCSEAYDKTSPMITNYSNKPVDLGSTQVPFSHDCIHIVNNNQFDSFLENLATTTSTKISFSPQNSLDCVIDIHGTFENCKKASTEIQNYVNTRKRKRIEPYFSRKKQKI